MTDHGRDHTYPDFDTNSNLEYVPDEETFNDDANTDEDFSDPRPTTNTAPQFKHQSFDLEKAGFRLIRLRPRREGAIQCMVFQAIFEERKDTITYEALSYAWCNECGPDILMDGTQCPVTR
jgi:hypothetical protein